MIRQVGLFFIVFATFFLLSTTKAQAFTYSFVGDKITVIQDVGDVQSDQCWTILYAIDTPFYNLNNQYFPNGSFPYRADQDTLHIDVFQGTTSNINFYTHDVEGTKIYNLKTLWGTCGTDPKTYSGQSDLFGGYGNPDVYYTESSGFFWSHFGDTITVTQKPGYLPQDQYWTILYAKDTPNFSAIDEYYYNPDGVPMNAYEGNLSGEILNLRAIPTTIDTIVMDTNETVGTKIYDLEAFWDTFQNNPDSFGNQATIFGDGSESTYFTIEDINPNTPPTIGNITVSSNPIQINSQVTVSASFSDSDSLDTHTAEWNWGDGTTSSGNVTESGGSGSAIGNHIYLTAGVYVITLTVTDSNNGIGTNTYSYISIYSPTPQGLFSAGSKFTSPAGSTIPNGNVLFGLSYKYQGTVPTGNRQFSMDFNQANLHFNGTTINSLVINNGSGTLTGTGSLNGTGTYNFLVVGDENTNMLRVSITDMSGNTIYDTQPGDVTNAIPTTLVTGNILAH